jgi:vanillate O-demethylase ferredoxin subunit
MLERGVFPSFDCRRGECGACLTRILAGEPLHRDVFQTEAEKAASAYMAVCVSRAKSPRLVLEA